MHRSSWLFTATWHCFYTVLGSSLSTTLWMWSTAFPGSLNSSPSPGLRPSRAHLSPHSPISRLTWDEIFLALLANFPPSGLAERGVLTKVSLLLSLDPFLHPLVSFPTKSSDSFLYVQFVWWRRQMKSKWYLRTLKPTWPAILSGWVRRVFMSWDKVPSSLQTWPRCWLSGASMRSSWKSLYTLAKL